MIRRIAVFTSGGDAPGMNAALRAVIRAGLAHGKEMFVIYDGYRGLLEGNIKQVTKDFTQDIINRGGTIIRSARLKEFHEEATQKKAARILRDYDIDAVIEDLLHLLVKALKLSVFQAQLITMSVQPIKQLALPQP